MSSSNKTSLGLNQWVESDTPGMSDFNGDNSIINNALVNLDNKIGQGVFLPDSTPGKSQTLNTKATDRALVALKGRTQVTKPNPEAEVSPENVATLTGVGNPTITAASTDGTQSNAQTIPYTLYNLPNGVCDEYDGVSGKLSKVIGKLTFSGTENWTKSSDQKVTGGTVFFLPMTEKNNLLCTHFKASVAADKELNAVSFTQSDTRVIYVCIENNKIAESTADAFKAYLSAQSSAGTPVTVLYELAEPVITYEQHDLACYADQTVVSCMDPVLEDSDMAVTVADGRQVFDATRADIAGNAYQLGGIPASEYLSVAYGAWDSTFSCDGCTVTVNYAEYEKIGKQVYIYAKAVLTPISGDTNYLRIRGLPYPHANGKNFYAGIDFFQSFNIEAVGVCGSISNQTIWIQRNMWNGTTTSTTNLRANEIHNTLTLTISGTYLTD